MVRNSPSSCSSDEFSKHNSKNCTFFHFWQLLKIILKFPYTPSHFAQKGPSSYKFSTNISKNGRIFFSSCIIFTKFLNPFVRLFKPPTQLYTPSILLSGCLVSSESIQRLKYLVKLSNSVCVWIAWTRSLTDFMFKCPNCLSCSLDHLCDGVDNLSRCLRLFFSFFILSGCLNCLSKSKLPTRVPRRSIQLFKQSR